VTAVIQTLLIVSDAVQVWRLTLCKHGGCAGQREQTGPEELISAHLKQTQLKTWHIEKHTAYPGYVPDTVNILASLGLELASKR
jgi:hypothetical protein